MNNIIDHNSNENQVESMSLLEIEYPNYPTDQELPHSTFCLENILVPTLPVLITPISLNQTYMTNLHQRNSGIPMRRNMEFHQDIGTAAYVSIVQDQPTKENEPVNNYTQENVLHDFVNFGSVCYADNENLKHQHQLNINEDHHEVRFHDRIECNETSININKKLFDVNPSKQQEYEKESPVSSIPSSINHESIESVDSLICAPVATASAGKSM